MYLSYRKANDSSNQTSLFYIMEKIVQGNYRQIS